MKESPDYNRTVFINCPFDEEYQVLFEAMIFIILSCGFIPRSAKESMNSDEIRINKIITLIKESRYAIHDLSRVELNCDSPLPRFNMPLELGIYIGCQRFGSGSHKNKKYLVLDKEPYRYKKFISDISGQDISGHNNDPVTLIEIIRGWISMVSNKAIPGSRFHLERYLQFKNELDDRCKAYKWDYDKLTYKEYNTIINEFINDKTVELIDIGLSDESS